MELILEVEEGPRQNEVVERRGRKGVKNKQERLQGEGSAKEEGKGVEEWGNRGRVSSQE